MYYANETIKSMINSPVRQIKARVELLDGSALLHTFTHDDRLISFDVERVGEGKFFGFGICQRLNVKLIDTNRELSIKTAHTLEIVLGAGSDYEYYLPPYKVSEVHRDEQTNELSITAYDWLYQAAEHTAAELDLPANYTIKTVAASAAALLGLNCRFYGLDDDSMVNTYYQNGANLDGTESVRALFDAIAEATQTIYFINNQWELVFKRLDRDGAPVLTIDRNMYFALESKTNRRLKTICHATELGDNVSAEMSENGSTQYMRDNPFFEMRDDIGALICQALQNIGGITINQFELDWRGNPLLEIGDKIALITKDGETVFSYLLDDVLAYDGTYSQDTRWAYDENETESESNAATLGDALKQTFARVDKVNREIALVASKAEDNASNIATLLLNTDSISATVEKIGKTTSDALSGINDEIVELTNRVSAQITADDVILSIETELENGVDKVITNTGFTFNDDGLTVSKSDSEMKTQITEDGMTVYKNDDAVLTANNNGVDAVNLHATTYLIIGNNSRFEDYGDSRTGCFWIGEV